MGTARLIATLPDWVGEARVYQVDPPMAYRNYGAGGDDYLAGGTEAHAEYVIVSAVVAYSGPETYIFPARTSTERPGGFESINSLELPGSFRGSLDHAQALNNAGYRVLD
jgi:hypothetical protein